MLSASNLSKSFGMHTLFKDVNFSVLGGEKIGLVGPNGCGKSTLLRILARKETPDVGSVRYTPSDLRIGYLPQVIQENIPNETLGEYLNRAIGGLLDIDRQVERLSQELAENPEDPGLQDRYNLALNKLIQSGDVISRQKSILKALDLDRLQTDIPVEVLSGGQKTRLGLLSILISKPQLLLLDEPTNHLDIPMLNWLENWIVDSDCGVLIVSHDRVFLDRTITQILELDPIKQSMKLYDGNFSDYVQKKEAARQQQLQAYQDQRQEIARLKRSSRHLRDQTKFKKGGKADSGDKFARGFFADRSSETMSKAKNVEHRIEQLLSDEKIEKPALTWQMRVDFPETVSSGRDVVIFEDLTVGYTDNPLVCNFSTTLRAFRRIALIGPNGSGKTTLLRTIAGLIPPIAGSVRLGANVQIGFMTQEHETLSDHLNVLSAFQSSTSLAENEARAFLSFFLFTGDEVFASVENLSSGERARLELACLVGQGCNLLLLDEPMNYLDVASRTNFEKALLNFEGTVLAVTHDRYFIDHFATDIWEITAGKRIIQSRKD